MFTFLVSISSCFFFFYSYGHHRDLHSFPTRRSSDLFSARRVDAVLRRIDARSHRAGNCRGTASRNRSDTRRGRRSEEHTSELQSHSDLVCRLLLEKKKKKQNKNNM